MKIRRRSKLIMFIRKIRNIIMFIINFFIDKYYSYRNRENRIKYKKLNKIRKKVVYTCIIGGYDTLEDHYYFNHDWDYICFTDSKKLLNSKNNTIWQIKPLQYNESDNIRNARWHKVNPHILFGNKYNESIWVDGNIRIKSHLLFKKIEKINKNFISAVHPLRNCIYKEAEICKKQNRDNKEIILAQIKELKRLKFPQNQKLYESNIIYRKHNEEQIKKMMEEWWWWIYKYSRRDQLSLNYVCWKYKQPFVAFYNWSFKKRNKIIKIIYHKI